MELYVREERYIGLVSEDKSDSHLVKVVWQGKRPHGNIEVNWISPEFLRGLTEPK